MHSMGGDNPKTRSIKLKLNRETIRELKFEELGAVSGGVTYSCCAGCDTTSGPTTKTCPPPSTYCPSNCGQTSHC
jgi:hypothetical protein